MSRTYEEDLQGVLDGSITADEAAARHGPSEVGPVLELHEQLSLIASVDVAVAPWYLVAPRLSSRPKRRRGRRALVVPAIAGLLLVPAAAEAIEAIAPDAVEGTVIDTITDVLPWDNDQPSDVDIPANPADSVPSDQPSDSQIPASTTAPSATDSTAVTRREVEGPTTTVSESREPSDRVVESDTGGDDRTPLTRPGSDTSIRTTDAPPIVDTRSSTTVVSSTTVTTARGDGPERTTTTRAADQGDRDS